MSVIPCGFSEPWDVTGPAVTPAGTQSPDPGHLQEREAGGTRQQDSKARAHTTQEKASGETICGITEAWIVQSTSGALRVLWECPQRCGVFGHTMHQPWCMWWGDHYTPGRKAGLLETWPVAYTRTYLPHSILSFLGS